MPGCDIMVTAKKTTFCKLMFFLRFLALYGFYIYVFLVFVYKDNRTHYYDPQKYLVPRSTQPSIPQEYQPLARVKARCVHLCRVAGNTV